MNIFVLDDCPYKCAKMHCDKHVVKMTLETAQIMSSVLRLRGSQDEELYRLTHAHHPCVKWAKSCIENFIWLGHLGIALGDEYTYRYNKKHKSHDIIFRCLRDSSANFPSFGEKTKFVQAMPSKYKNHSTVEAYRDYYKGEKKEIANWKNRPKPDWW